MGATRIPNIFPTFKSPQHLAVADITHLTWDEQILFTSLQGLINRSEPRTYLVSDEVDERWLLYYRQQFKIRNEQVVDPWRLLESFKDELDGFVIYDSELLDSVNVAQMIGEIKNMLPASEQLSTRLLSLGLQKLDDLRGRWRGRYEAQFSSN